MKRWHLKFASFSKSNDIFDAVVNGQKTIETRPVNPESNNNPAQYKPGDILVLTSLDTGDVLEKKISFVHVYLTVDTLAESEPVSHIVPFVSTKDDLIDFFEVAKKKWGSSYKKKLEQYGIVAIGME